MTTSNRKSEVDKQGALTKRAQMKWEVKGEKENGVR